jgi:hypothetical protein
LTKIVAGAAPVQPDIAVVPLLKRTGSKNGFSGDLSAPAFDTLNDNQINLGLAQS